MENISEIDNKVGNTVEVEEASANAEKQIQAPYPSEPINPMISLVKQIVTAKGEINPISRKDISIITGKAEATLSMKLSTCVQYGILRSSFGKGYLPGDLYHKYTYEDQPSSLLLIFSSPPLYKKLIDDLNGKMLPNEQDFANHLKNNYGLNPNSSARAARVFLENARNLNLIDNNNRLKVVIKDGPPKAQLISNTNSQESTHQHTDHKHVEAKQPSNPSLFKLPIQLPGEENRVAYFEYPKNLSKRDFKVIAKALTFVASSLIADDDNEDYELIINVTENKGQNNNGA